MDLIGDRTVRTLWEHQRATRPDEEFLVFEDIEGETETFTYREFDDRINATARAFADDLGVEKGDKVVIHFDNSPEYLSTWYALMKIGGVPVHSNTNHTAREVNYTVDNSDAREVVTEPAHLDVINEAVEGTAADRVTLGRTDESDHDGPLLSSLVAAADPDPPEVELSADDEAQILFTSGTTAAPKGVVHTHANLVWSAERFSKSSAMRSDERILSALPAFHVNAQGTINAALNVGGTMIMLEEYETGKYFQQIRDHGATFTSLVGMQVKALMATPETDQDDDHDLREIVFAINVSNEVKEAFTERFDVSLLSVYGLTEACTGITLAPVYDDRKWPSEGLPMFERKVHLVDEDDNEVETGEVGEITTEGVRGRTVFKEYYDMPEKTEEAFTEQGWLKTGDMGRFDEDGYLYFVDRKKNIVESRGENVSESEVEGVLEGHPKVAAVGVIGVPHDLYGEAVKAFVRTADPSLTAEELIEYAEEQLAYFKVPEEVEFVESLPRTAIGKVEKKTLRQREGVQ